MFSKLSCLEYLKNILENTLISVLNNRKSWWQPRIVRLNQGPYAIQNIITHHLLHLKVPDLDRKKVIVPSHVLYRMLTGCPCPFRPMARFQACSIVPLSQDNEGTSVPLSLCPGTKKFCLSRCPEKLHRPVPLETLLASKWQSWVC